MSKRSLPTDSITTVSEIESKDKSFIMFAAHCSCTEDHNHRICVEKWNDEPYITTVTLYQDISCSDFETGFLAKAWFRISAAFKMLVYGSIKADGEFVFTTEQQVLAYAKAIKDATKRPKVKARE